MRNQKGFSLLEALVTMSIFAVVMLSVYVMVEHYADFSRSEQSRRHMEQEGRYLTTNFAQELKNAGSVLTLANTGTFLGALPYFNGIFPLNMDNDMDYPDGIIVAAGDPEAVSMLTAPYQPSSDGNSIPVKSTIVAGFDPNDPNAVRPWAAGDRAIIIGSNGYYVFSVSAVQAVALQRRETAVYFNGLLNTVADVDGDKSYTDAAATNGDVAVYPANAPVVRLSNFGIYLFREVTDPKDEDRIIRQLIKVTDTLGGGDVFMNNSTAEMSIISENIWDMQITYTAYANFSTVTPDTVVDNNHYYYAGGDSSTLTANLLTDIRIKSLKRMNVFFVSKSDEFEGKGERSFNVPPLGDRSGYELPAGKYTIKVSSLGIEPRNYNIIL